MILLAALAALQAAAAVPRDIDAAVLAGIRNGAYPGAVAVVGTGGRVLAAKGYGHLTWSPASKVPSPDSTLYDLASLTKVIATTSAIMLLVDRGRIGLDRPVRQYLPAFTGAGKERVTVRDLLEHRSGLRAGLRLDTLARDAAEAKRLVLTEPLRWAPRSRTVYSDLNAMLLGWIVESASQATLDRFTQTDVFGPLGMSETRFVPPRSLGHRIAPVGVWRGHPVGGEVHDQNAARFGGVSGHAGLFATGSDLARYAQWILNRGRAASGRQVIRPEIVEAFYRRGPGNRALGWELRDTTSADNTGHALSAATFGHTGFTGTSLWIDPDRGLFVLLLTNRVYSPRTGKSFSQLRQVRGAVADAAVGMMDVACAGSSTTTKATC